MLTPPRQLISPLILPAVRESLIFNVECSIYLNWALILTSDFSIYLTRRIDFDSGLFRLPNLDILIFAFEIGHTAGATGQ
jgi:hypothetical protein